jgi:hypothetical protein
MGALLPQATPLQCPSELPPVGLGAFPEVMTLVDSWPPHLHRCHLCKSCVGSHKEDDSNCECGNEAASLTGLALSA